VAVAEVARPAAGAAGEKTEERQTGQLITDQLFQLSETGPRRELPYLIHRSQRVIR
jgi:hypothetical protein